MLIEVYERRLARALEGADIPRHVGVIMDGNRRWARAIGLEDVAHGHRRGADKIVDLLGWCDDAGVSVVTLFMLSTDNLRRPEPELSALLQIIEDVAVDLSRPGRPVEGAGDGGARGAAAGDGRRPQAGRGGHPRPAGRHGEPRRRLRRTAGDRRRRPLAAGRARRARHLAGRTRRGARGRAHRRAPLHPRASPIPDLVIRTSGEQRLSGFLLWQTANTEFHFTDVYWPDFRRVDFLRALRDYSARHRRFGG